MARKKPAQSSGGAPEWVLTYGDMMSLLLTFFILLVSLSEIKKEDEWKAIVEQVQKAFGMSSGGGNMPTKEDPELSFIQIKETLRSQDHIQPNHAQIDIEGMEGPQPQVTRVREGLIFVQGGRIIFEPGSADLTIKAKRQLRSVAAQLRGKNNVIEIRGHAAALELAGGNDKFSDLENLSYVRAKQVMEYLTQDEFGIAAARFRLIACGDHEPLNKRDYNLGEQEPNRRVEVFEDEALIQDFMKPEMN
ncbi:MAG: OmpA family protein [Phycisphaeraceae bacterium]|nr:OmpA family protein [Phycisphaeraceae bacterium]